MIRCKKCHILLLPSETGGKRTNGELDLIKKGKAMGVGDFIPSRCPKCGGRVE